MRDPRLRSDPISGRSSVTTGGGGGGTARSCILRASFAETATGPVGTEPLNAATDLPGFSRCRRSIRRRGGTRFICGSSFGCGGGGATTTWLCNSAAAGAAALAGSLRFWAGTGPGTAVFTLRTEAIAVAVFFNSFGALASVATRKSRARSRRVISSSS